MRVIEADGEPALAVAIRDFTERRRRAAALREAGERFRRLFEDGTPSAFFVLQRTIATVAPGPESAA